MPGIADLFHVAIKTNNLLDHATGFHGFIERFKKRGLDWRQFKAREAGLWQLFVDDPSGVLLEISRLKPLRRADPSPI